MKLREILIKAENLDARDVVYAKRPWSLDSSACVVRYDSDERLPRHLSDASFEYFLDAELIQDIRGQIKGAGRPPGEEFDVVLYYAENDAFPPQ